MKITLQIFLAVLSFLYCQQQLPAQKNTSEKSEVPRVKAENYHEQKNNLQKGEKPSGDYRPDNNVYKNLKKPEKENNVAASPVSVNLSLRENDIYKSPVVAKYFSSEKLNNLKENKPEKISQIDFYFNKSFTFELMPGVISDQKKTDEFIAGFDPYLYETQRKSAERAYIDFREAGIRAILLSENELPFKIPEKFKNKDKRNSGCKDCKDGKTVPKSAGEIRNKQ